MERFKTRKSWDGSWNGTFTQEGNNGNLSQAPIVQFATLLGLESDRVHFGEVKLGKDNRREWATHHVVRLVGFRCNFGNQDCAKNLSLA
jgi:hypothetical protein